MSAMTMRQAALVSLYTLYEDAIATTFATACEKGCATCCSVNVTMTSLEARHLLTHPFFTDAQARKIVADAGNHPRFIPSLTINRLAEACLLERHIPEETGIHAAGTCPFLDDSGLCRVYSHRPFACRSMFSTTRCREDGAAEMPPFLYTVNLALCQLIEHLDSDGHTGNMIDMLAGERNQTIANTPLPGFPVPPADRQRLKKFLARLRNYPVEDVSLADFFPAHLLCLENGDT
jgi:Fe-S-cluster containining protein